MHLFFDLDGTLTDPATGICGCLQYALRRLGRPAPAAAELRRFIGPPLRGTLATLLDSREPAVIESALSHYRERFSRRGIYENQVYADIPAGLAALQAAGHRLWVVTSKPETYARRIIAHFGLGRYFQRVYGSELSGARVEKSELIAFVLERQQLEPASACMIGDRAQDILGGRANGTGTVGVLWGYGGELELQDAGPDHLARSMATLLEYMHRTQETGGDR